MVSNKVTIIQWLQMENGNKNKNVAITAAMFTTGQPSPVGRLLSPKPTARAATTGTNEGITTFNPNLFSNANSVIEFGSGRCHTVLVVKSARVGASSVADK